jgi:SAM-dependent methyltransferase
VAIDSSLRSVIESERQRLRGIFGEDAERYDRRRPAYPQQMFDDITVLAQAGPRPRVLEIGCGSGQATLPLARFGGAVVAVELSADMAALARRNLAGFPAVEVVVSAFEDWPLPAEPFDLALSATAFHWIDPDLRMIKTADALRRGGDLLLTYSNHRALPPAARNGLLTCIANLIDKTYNGRITKRYLTQVAIAHRT